MKKVQKLLKDYTDGGQSKLNDEEFAVALVKDAEQLSLVPFDTAKPSGLKLYLSAMLLKI